MKSYLAQHDACENRYRDMRTTNCSSPGSMLWNIQTNIMNCRVKSFKPSGTMVCTNFKFNSLPLACCIICNVLSLPKHRCSVVYQCGLNWLDPIELCELSLHSLSPLHGCLMLTYDAPSHSPTFILPRTYPLPLSPYSGLHIGRYCCTIQTSFSSQSVLSKSFHQHHVVVSRKLPSSTLHLITWICKQHLQHRNLH